MGACKGGDMKICAGVGVVLVALLVGWMAELTRERWAIDRVEAEHAARL
jgi:hypothetical protein